MARVFKEKSPSALLTLVRFLFLLLRFNPELKAKLILDLLNQRDAFQPSIWQHTCEFVINYTRINCIFLNHFIYKFYYMKKTTHVRSDIYLEL